MYESHICIIKETTQFVVNLTNEIPHSNHVTKERAPKKSYIILARISSGDCESSWELRLLNCIQLRITSVKLVGSWLDLFVMTLSRDMRCYPRNLRNYPLENRKLVSSSSEYVDWNISLLTRQNHPLLMKSPLALRTWNQSYNSLFINIYFLLLPPPLTLYWLLVRSLYFPSSSSFFHR